MVSVEKNGDNLLLISNNIIKKMRFGKSYFWVESEVRNWLNNDFYNEALNDNERKMIQAMITSDTTEDKIFCLSAEEARLFYSSDEERIATVSEALIKDGFKDYNNAGEWWTRSISTAKNGKGVVDIEAAGTVSSAGCNPLALEELAYTDIGVRPVISVNLVSISTSAVNMAIYGHDSNTGLDNEKFISSSSNNYTTEKKCKSGKKM